MNPQAKWISAFKDNNIVAKDLAGKLKDVYEGFDPKDLPQDTKAFMFVKDFSVNKKLKSAELKVTACGYFEAYINGSKIGDHVLTPSFTDYDKVIYYSSYDISNYIKSNNRIGLLVGNGFYNQYEDDEWGFGKAFWRGNTKACVTLSLSYDDGTCEDIVSDESWLYSESYIQYQNIRSGEYHDMNMYKSDWCLPNNDIFDWNKVYLHPAPKGKLCKEIINPVKKFSSGQEEVKIVKIEKTDDKTTLITLDKNTVGWARIKLKGVKDDIIKIEFIESEKTNLASFTYNTFQTFEVKLSGGEDICEPKFSYYGFQYIKIYGNYEIKAEDITIYSVHNDFVRYNNFSCNNETINKIHEMCARTYILNWQSIPTDCPTREKNGWTGDGWLGISYGLLNFDSILGYKKWLLDIAGDWDRFGDPSPIIPNPGWSNLKKENKTWDPTWAGVMIMLCYYIYKYTQDINIISEFYPYMKAYIDRVESLREGDLLSGENSNALGDWVDIDFDWRGAKSKWTEPYCVTNMIYYNLLKIMTGFANILGKGEDEKSFSSSLSIKDKINKKWYNFDKNYYFEKSLTASALGILFDMIPQDNYENHVTYFLKVIDDFDNKLNCGIVGIWAIFDTLAKIGQKQKALDIILNSDYPGFSYMINEGATTLWETWDGLSSRNHPMFGTVDGFIQKSIGGLDYIDGEFILTVPDLKEIDKAKTSLKTNRGLVSCSWERQKDNYIIDIDAPDDLPIKLLFDSMPDFKDYLYKGKYTIGA